MTLCVCQSFVIVVRYTHKWIKTSLMSVLDCSSSTFSVLEFMKAVKKGMRYLAVK